MSSLARVSMPQLQDLTAEVAIIGGGIAGLWLLNVLAGRGYDVVLCERSALGAGKTIASQGMIHGGLKYALGGRLTGAADAIAGMPARWRRCLAGGSGHPGDVDLRGVRVLSDRYYMWSNDSALGRLGGFLASRLLRGRIVRLPRSEFPPAFSVPSFNGSVYEIGDLVLDVPSLLGRLAAPHRERIWHFDVGPESIAVSGTRPTLRLDERLLTVDTLIFAAGAGNEALLAAWPFETPRMQRRPLHQVIVRDIEHPPLYAHWIGNLTRPEPRLTVTSHRQRDGRWSWYLGGQLATDGAVRARAAQIDAARMALSESLPWLDYCAAQFETLRVDRAEPFQPSGRRPDAAFVRCAGSALVCWPTKLSLVPDLADRVLAALGERPARPERADPHSGMAGFAALRVATPPWEA
jgi:glycine/D-amino acid oxidase-like deaminating enzyme